MDTRLVAWQFGLASLSSWISQHSAVEFSAEVRFVMCLSIEDSDCWIGGHMIWALESVSLRPIQGIAGVGPDLTDLWLLSYSSDPGHRAGRWEVCGFQGLITSYQLPDDVWQEDSTPLYSLQLWWRITSLCLVDICWRTGWLRWSGWSLMSSLDQCQ